MEGFLDRREMMMMERFLDRIKKFPIVFRFFIRLFGGFFSLWLAGMVMYGFMQLMISFKVASPASAPLAILVGMLHLVAIGIALLLFIFLAWIGFYLLLPRDF